MLRTGERITCYGNVRSDCGVMHRTVRTAAACLHRDSKACRAQGGYSDRRMVVVDGDGDTVKLSDQRWDALNDAQIDLYA